MSSPPPEILHLGLPEYCTPTTPFLIKISSDFNTCVPTPLAFVSTCLGILSIVTWLFALPPQIYKNFVLKSASGLSPYFLAVWFLGDLTNLLGGLFTGQAVWQVVDAAYFVSVDVILAGQYFWYTYGKSWGESRLEEDDLGKFGEDDENPSEVFDAVSPTNDMETSEAIQPMSTKSTETDNRSIDNTSAQQHGRLGEKKAPPSGLSSFNEKSRHPKIVRIQPSPPLPTLSPRTVLFLSTLFTILATASPLHSPSPSPTVSSLGSSPLEPAGRILSWTSTLFYLGSRLPQIYKNRILRSTAGLSPVLFAAAFTGNLFYTISVTTNPLAWASSPPHGLHGWAGPEGSDRVNWILLAAPFWIGAAGVLVLDATIGMQFWRFGEGVEDTGAKGGEAIKTQGKRGRWRKVKGWMRGWVPSPGPRSRSNEHGEESSLLGEERENRHGRNYNGG